VYKFFCHKTLILVTKISFMTLNLTEAASRVAFAALAAFAKKLKIPYQSLPEGQNTGLPGEDTFTASTGNDRFGGGHGSQIIVDSQGSELLKGGPGDNHAQVDCQGGRQGCTFLRNPDGSIRAQFNDAEHVKTLIGTDGVWFDGSFEWVLIEELFGEVPVAFAFQIGRAEAQFQPVKSSGKYAVNRKQLRRRSDL
jgi:hypothetical protein